MAGIKWTGKKSYWLKERAELGDGRAEGLATIRDGRQAAVSLTPDLMAQVLVPCWNQMHILIFESSQLEGSYLGY